MDFDEDRSHIWLIYCDNADRKCVMTSNEADSNWFRDVKPAESSLTANVLAISMADDQLYLVTGPSGVPPFTKLKYFAKEDPTTEFWTSWTQAWANQKRCSRCSIHGQFDNVADYRVHISLWHDVSFQVKNKSSFRVFFQIFFSSLLLRSSFQIFFSNLLFKSTT